MKLRPSRVLREVRAGRPATVLKLNLNDPRIVEMAGLAGASAVWLCNEHVPNDWTNLEHQVRIEPRALVTVRTTRLVPEVA